MDELTVSRRRQAEALHAQIMAAGRMIGRALVEMAAELKQMRDDRLYTELGHASFEEYLKAEVGIGIRQAYNYISTYERLQPQLMEQYADAGITKLQLLCEISAPERVEFAEQADLAAISVEELKKLVEEKNGLHEQLSLLTQERDAAMQKLESETGELGEKAGELVDRLREELADAQKKTEEVRWQADKEAAEQFAAGRAAAAKQVEYLEHQRAAAQKAMEKAREMAEKWRKAAEGSGPAQQKELEALRQELEKTKAAAAEAAKTVSEEAAAKLKAQGAAEERERAQRQADEQTAAARAETEELRRKLAASAGMAANKEIAEFAVLLKQLQQTARRMKEIADGVVDEAQQAKLRAALQAVKETL